jgi:membrane fusion protein, multidrug efflux system
VGVWGRVLSHPYLFTAGVALIVIALVGLITWWLHARHFEWTDDAFIDARQFAVAPKVAGYVATVNVTDNQLVKPGDTIARIEDADYRVAVAQAQARFAQAQANIKNVDAEIAMQNAQVHSAELQQQESEAALKFAEEENERAQRLMQTAVGTVQRAQQTKSQLDQARAMSDRARTGVDLAQKQYASLRAQRDSAVADASAAEANLAQARLNLTYTRIVTAQAGRVVHLSAAKGEFVQVGQSLSLFVPATLWVTANFKETQITDMRPGQPVKIEIDAFPDHKLEGRVDSIQPGSGTAFSLLPAENATGNFVKVVQRVPVKISIISVPPGLTLGPGMSVVPEVRVR